MEENDIANKRNQLQDEFVSNVTLHGYRYLFVSDKKRRCAWWIFFFAALMFAIWLFIGAVSDFFRYETYTSVKTDYNIDKLDFPTLTLCPHQPYTTLNKHRFPIKMNDQFYQRLFKEIFSIKKDNISTQTKSLLKQLESNGIDTYEKLVQLMTIDINDTINGNVTKAFQPRGCVFNFTKCSHEDFRMIIDIFHAPCQQYNYFSPQKESKKQERPNKLFWFDGFFNLHDDRALGADINGKGIKLYMHERNRPHLRQFDVEVTLQAGILTTITLEELKTTKLLPPPYGECGISPYRIIKNYPYSLPMCQLDCFLDVWYSNCGCVGFSYKNFLKENKKICNTEKMVQCHRKIIGNDFADTKACVKTCRQECIQNKYSLRLETVSLLSATRVQRVRKNTGWNKTDEEIIDYIKNNIVGLRVGFTNLVQRNETTTPSVTITTLLGTIGGSIGLGLGFSVLTLVEFLLFFVDYIYLCAGKQPVKPDMSD